LSPSGRNHLTHYFLHCFHPLVKLANQQPFRKYVPHIPIPDSESLPPIDLTIYLLWDVEPSPEPVGWYKCQISSHSADGLSIVIYPNHCTDTIDLCLQKWELTRANAPRYLPPKKPPPHAALPRVWEKVKKPKALSAKPHCAKTFADDIPVLSSNKSDHQFILNSIQQSCTTLDLVLKPAKCLSFCFSGKANIPDQCFNVGDKLITKRDLQTCKVPG